MEPVLYYFESNVNEPDRRRFHSTGPCHFAMLLEGVEVYDLKLSGHEVSLLCSVCNQPLVKGGI